MSSESDAARDAETLVGANEVSDNARLREYFRTGGVGMNPRDLAWCAGFINATLAHEGVAGTGSLMAGSFLNWGHAVDPMNVAAGDVLVKKDRSHVGMAEGPSRMGPNGPEVLMIAGNERDRSGDYSPAPGRSQVGKVGERWVSLSEFEARRSNGETTTVAAADRRRPDDRTYDAEALHAAARRESASNSYARVMTGNRPVAAARQPSSSSQAAIPSSDTVPFVITTTVVIRRRVA